MNIMTERASEEARGYGRDDSNYFEQRFLLAGFAQPTYVMRVLLRTCLVAEVNFEIKRSGQKVPRGGMHGTNSIWTST